MWKIETPCVWDENISSVLTEFIGRYATLQKSLQFGKNGDPMAFFPANSQVLIFQLGKKIYIKSPSGVMMQLNSIWDENKFHDALYKNNENSIWAQIAKII